MTARRRLLSRALSFSFLFAALASMAAAGIAPYVWQEKVDPIVLTQSSGSTEFIVFLAEQADLKGAEALRTRLEKGQYVFQTLSETARKTQQPILDSLASLGAEYRPYWIANMVWVRGDMTVVQGMAERADVAHVYANPLVPMSGPVRGDEPADVSTPSAIEWGVLKIRADLVWSAGFDGLGVVIGGQDTGYDWTHTAIKDQYRGWNGTSANHNYNWHDSIHSGGGVCGADTTAPCDDNNHGTHTMGTMVGDDGGANQIGVAPGARWIGCRNMDQGNGTPITYSECFQWFIAPTDLAGLNADPGKAPDVINNSWICPPSEGCTDPNVMKTVVDNTRAAGIVVVVSAGNSGPNCSTVTDPAAIYESSFSIGATSSTDVIANFSSRGPVTADGSNRLKPNVSAPGVSVRSSIRNGGYATYSGTSMAGPHTAGAVALLIDAKPSLDGQVGSIETILETTAVPRTTTTQTCGGVSGTTIPNNTYGFGRIDTYSALLSISANLGVSLTESADPIQTGTNLTWSITVTNGGPAIATATTVTDSLPSGATYVSATPSTGTCSETSGTVTCNLGDMAAGTATIDVVVTFAAEGSYTNNVTATSTTLDLTSANNSAQISTSVCAVPPTPSITTPLSVASGSSGNSASIPATSGHTYSWSLSGGGSINGASNTSAISFTAGFPATIMTFGVTESSLTCTSALATRRVFVDFLDVPIGSTFHDFVVTIAMNNITLGCTGTNYCPEGFVPRRTMAAFMARAMAGTDAGVPPSGTVGASAYNCTPSGGTSLFSDVAASDPFCRHIHYIAAQNVTLGCRPGAFCPSDNVSRDQMAAFVSRAMVGSDAVPSIYTDPGTGRSYDIPNGNVHFTDMTGSTFSRYAHYLWATGKIDGCTGTTYCPTTLVTRRQMAKFLTNGFDLTAP